MSKMYPVAAIYCRLSEEERNKKSPTKDSESILNQVLLLTQYAKEQGWGIYDCYLDDNQPGANRNRPAFCRLLADAKEKKFDIVLCKTQSRFTRELELVEKYIHGLFPVWGIRFVSVVDHGDSSVKGNKKARQINGLMNEWYLEDLSENIKSVLTMRREEGYYIGSIPLYGYRKEAEKKGCLFVDEEAAKVVRLIFASYVEGMGKSAIARMLNENGIPNPTEYKRKRGLIGGAPKHKVGTLWSYDTVSSILKNEMYLGNLVQGKYASVSYKTHINKPVSKENWIRVEKTHVPIIDENLWDMAQNMQKNKVRASKSGTIGPFARKVICKHCGYTMRSGKSHGKFYLKCPTKSAKKDACIGSFLSVELLERIVLEEIEKMNGQYLNQEDIEEMLFILGRRQGRCQKEKQEAEKPDPENQKQEKQEAEKWNPEKQEQGNQEVEKWNQKKQEQGNQEKEKQKLKRQGAENQEIVKRIRQIQQAMKELYLDKVRGILNEERFLLLLEELEGEKKEREAAILNLELKLPEEKIQEKNLEEENLQEKNLQKENLQEENLQEKKENAIKFNPIHLNHFLVETLIDHIEIARIETQGKDAGQEQSAQKEDGKDGEKGEKREGGRKKAEEKTAKKKVEITIFWNF